MGQTRRRLFLSALLGTLAALPAQAQPARNAVRAGAVALPRVFAGAGVGAIGDDALARMRLARKPSPWVWTIEGGVRLARRVGAGVEIVMPGATEVATAGRSFNTSARQEERYVFGVARVRAAAAHGWALDLVGGAGGVFQHVEGQFAPCFRGCASIVNETRDRTAPAFVAGVDVPWRIAAHVELAPTVRVYKLQRERIESTPPNFVPFAYETHPSLNIAAVVSGRVVW